MLSNKWTLFDSVIESVTSRGVALASYRPLIVSSDKNAEEMIKWRN